MMETEPNVEVVRLPELAGVGGVVWSAPADGFHANLVVLAGGGRIERHRNDEVDVLFVVMDGKATLTVDDAPAEVAAGDAVVVPRGAMRSIIAGPSGARYLTVHAPREPLAIKGSGRFDV